MYILIKTGLPKLSAGIVFGKGETYVEAEDLSEKQIMQLRDDFPKEGFSEVEEAPDGAKIVKAPKAKPEPKVKEPKITK